MFEKESEDRFVGRIDARRLAGEEIVDIVGGGRAAFDELRVRRRFKKDAQDIRAVAGRFAGQRAGSEHRGLADGRREARFYAGPSSSAGCSRSMTPAEWLLVGAAALARSARLRHFNVVTAHFSACDAV
ncbi:hypothetical protein HT746_22895 [Burkholderia pyrrocinia]|uniref:hypothetical protein n=1 Tax=Burkholderia pyrrocinia TaxID=60550 RepID=UPI00157633E6|nr:hypothetical protein [Burkholderia pyrrocinia]NTX29930.1 hypothetical protein [Burkholderia pyrrocinia]